MEKKRPQLNLAELHQLKWLLGGALAVLSGWTVFYMDVDAWTWLVLISVATPLVTMRPSLTLLMPRWAHRLAFPLFVGLFATDFYLNREPLPAMIRLAMMLVFYRAITPRKRRDDLQLIVLGLFLVVVAGVLSVSLAFAVQIVVFTGCALLFLMVINLIDSAEAGQPVADSSTPPAWMQIEWGRLARRVHEATDWRVALLGMGLFGGVVASAALLFFALPRFELGNSFFLDSMITRQAKTGFSESVRFGDVTDIQQDTSVAMRVEVNDRRAIPADPYWRMLVLDSYEDGMFTVSRELDDQTRSQRRKSARVAGSSRPRQDDAVWTFYLEPSTTRYLPMLGGFYQTAFDAGPQDYAISDVLRILRLEKVPAKMFAYRVEGMRDEPEMGAPEVVPPRDPEPLRQDMSDEYGSRERPPAPMPDFLRISLKDADDLAHVGRWAKALGRTDDPRAFAVAACEWLAAGHSYSLQSRLDPGTGDPLVRWMGSSSPGHCELFAGAFTLLARAAGHPARMVTGFRGGTWNEGAAYLSIRNSDAHAWCEIFDPRTQTWLRVDPTPGAPLPGQAARAESTEAVLARISDRSWSARVDALRMFWYRRIVDFDQTSQVELAREAKSAIEAYGKAFKLHVNEKLRDLVEWLRAPWDFVRLAVWGAALVFAIVAALLWRTHGHVAWLSLRSSVTSGGHDPVRKEAGRWLRRLESREEGTDIAQVRTELQRLRYGPRPTWPNPQRAFRQAKRACSKRL